MFKLRPTLQINSFDQCVNAGYGILESFPPQCCISGVRCFTADISPEETVPLPESCKNLCGDGVCQEEVCMAIGCPCPETPENCPEDCMNQSETSLTRCGIENCHGLDITCGSDIADVCTLMYALGDNCRRYASCKVVNGRCQLVKEPKFDSCASCVQNCTDTYEQDLVKLFECESSCY